MFNSKHMFWYTLQHPEVELQDLFQQGCQLIASRVHYETRHGAEQDDGLCGLLHMLAAIAKFSLHIKKSSQGKVRRSYYYVILCVV